MRETSVKKRLYVGNLPQNVNNNNLKALKDHFAVFGKVLAIDVKSKRGPDVGGPGGEVKTFAYVDINLSDRQVKNVLVKSCDWDGHQLVVQLAKESVLMRLEEERKQKEGKDTTSHGKDDKKATFSIYSVKSKSSAITGEKPERAEPKPMKAVKVTPKFEREPDKVQEPIEQVVRRIPAAREYHSNSSSDEEEVAKRAKAFDDKKQQLTESNVKRKEIDNQRRLESIKRLEDQKKQQSNLIKAALSSTKTMGKKIIFGDNERKTSVDKKGDEVAKKRKSLFGDDEDGDDSDVEAKFEEKVKEGIKGEKSEKLIELQSRFAHDPRFRVDQRFLEDDREGQSGDEEEAARETDKNLAILEEVLGKPIAKKRDNLVNNRPLLVPRFDPMKANTEQYEIKRHIPVKADSKKASKAKEIEAKDKEIAAASKERFFEVSTNLKDALTEAKAEAEVTPESFSLNKLFGREWVEEQPAEEANQVVTFEKPIKPHSNPFRYDSSGSEDEQQSSHTQRPKKVARIYPESGVKGNAGNESMFFTGKFFFTKNDPRFSEDTFFRTDLVEKAKEGGSQRKQQMVQIMARRKRHFKKKSKEDERQRNFQWKQKRVLKMGLKAREMKVTETKR